jgi:predicted transcriptional regulator
MNESVAVSRDMRLAICSERRRSVLISLYEGKKPLVELHKELSSTSPALIHALRELEGHHLVREDRSRQYELTSIGRSTARKVIDFGRTMEVLTEHEVFWCEHDLCGFPDHVLDRIGWLRDAMLVTGTAPDVFKAMRRFVELLKESTVVRLVSSIYIPNIDAILVEKFASEAMWIELVLSEAVMHHFISEVELARLKEARCKQLTLRVLHDDPKLVTVVTDHFVALALYRVDGTFDHSCMLTSEHPEAIAWGQQLFDHYVSESAAVAL